MLIGCCSPIEERHALRGHKKALDEACIQPHILRARELTHEGIDKGEDDGEGDGLSKAHGHEDHEAEPWEVGLRSGLVIAATVGSGIGVGLVVIAWRQERLTLEITFLVPGIRGGGSGCHVVSTGPLMGGGMG